MNIEQQIAKLGWTLERNRIPCEPELWWSTQGGFVTPRRETPEMVLEDVKNLAKSKTEVAAALIETNPKAALAEFRNE